MGTLKPTNNDTVIVADLLRFVRPRSGKEMNRSKTRTTRARFRIIRANGKVEQHILIFDPAELHSPKVNVFVQLHPGDRLEQARPKTSGWK